MTSKAEQTTKYIIEKVAPIFNKNGYNGTSMSAITEATGLTKGAVYGNFKNKEDLVFAAFQYNIDKVVNLIKSILIEIESPLEQLRGLVNFYRKYKQHTIKIGGCPILNVGVDANNQNPKLLTRVQAVVLKLQFYIQKMIELAQEADEVKKEIDAEKYAKRIFALIEGAIFMTTTMKDDFYIDDMMVHVDQIINEKLVK